MYVYQDKNIFQINYIHKQKYKHIEQYNRIF